MDMAEKIWFFGTKESLLLKARSGERYAHCVHCHIPTEIDYGKINVETNLGTAVSTRTTSLTWRH